MRGKLVSRVMALIALVALYAPLAQAGHGGGSAPPSNINQLVPLSCRAINGVDENETINLTDAFGNSPQVRIGGSRLLCTVFIGPVPGSTSGPSTVNALKCYSVATNAQQGTPEPNDVSVDDGFHVGESVTVTGAKFLCMPAFVTPE